VTDPKAKVAIADLAATPWKVLPLLVAMNGIAPVSLYMLVPMLPLLATSFQQVISVVQMTVSL
jgi:DHA1 family bicyclomycin/chloramphenicol resistance-like MFS transporter